MATMGPKAQPPETDLGRFIWERAQARGMTKSGLAQALGVPYSTVQSWFVARIAARPDPSKQEGLARVLVLSDAERAELARLAGKPRDAELEPAPAQPERSVTRASRYFNANAVRQELERAGERVDDDVFFTVDTGVQAKSEYDMPPEFWRAQFRRLMAAKREAARGFLLSVEEAVVQYGQPKLSAGTPDHEADAPPAASRRRPAQKK